MKRRILLFCLLLTFAVTGCRGEPATLAADADPANLPDLLGTYVVNGVDPLGTEYGGHLTIVVGDAPGTYEMQWLLTGNVQAGQAVVDGNVLRAEWWTLEAVEPVSGVVTYTITSEGQLYGLRLAEGWSQPGQETAYPNLDNPSK